jgi:hypothetical protein
MRVQIGPAYPSAQMRIGKIKIAGEVAAVSPEQASFTVASGHQNDAVRIEIVQSATQGMPN